MRGTDTQQVTMLSLVTPDRRVPADHPLRRLKALADQALAALSPTFDAMYSTVGRPSVPPERLLKGTLPMALCSIRSERLLCEQLEYNLLYRWFLDMDMVEEGIDHSTFSRNRARPLAMGYGEREGALALFVAAVRERGITPHVARTRDTRRRLELIPFRGVLPAVGGGFPDAPFQAAVPP